MYTVDPTHSLFFVFLGLKSPWTYPQRLRHTAQDAADLAEEIGNQGVLNRWYHGRITLAGDSVNKVSEIKRGPETVGLS